MTYIIRSIVGPESIDATDDGVLFGLAIPYNKVTTIGDLSHGGFREQIAPGACSKSLREADIVALWNHSSEHPLGRTSAGNLKLTSTVRGVEVPELRPVPTSYAQDLALNVKAGVVRGWSFGFEVIKDDWLDDDGKPSNEWVGTQRTIREMKLIEVSPVTFPAYEMTEISARDSLLREREIRASQMTSQTTRGGNAPGEGDKPYGNVTYADPGYQSDGKKRYPIDTAAHAKAAWSYINKAKNAGAYSADQLSKIKAKIKAACKKFGIEISEENAAQLAKEWRVKRYDPLTGERRHDATIARCDRCGAQLRCLNCDRDIDIDENSRPGTPSDETTSKKVKAVKRARKALRGIPDPAALAKMDPDQLKALKASTKQTLSAIKAGKKLAKAQADAADDSDSSDDDDDSQPSMSDGTIKRIPQIDAALKQALTMFGAADVDSLPDDIKTAIGLVSSAATHASHIMDHQDGISAGSAVSDNDKAGRSRREDHLTDGDPIQCEVCGHYNNPDAEVCEECGAIQTPNSGVGRNAKTPAKEKRAPKPAQATSAKLPDDDALRQAHFEALSREFDLGL